MAANGVVLRKNWWQCGYWLLQKPKHITHSGRWEWWWKWKCWRCNIRAEVEAHKRLAATEKQSITLCYEKITRTTKKISLHQLSTLRKAWNPSVCCCCVLWTLKFHRASARIYGTMLKWPLLVGLQQHIIEISLTNTHSSFRIMSALLLRSNARPLIPLQCRRFKE